MGKRCPMSSPTMPSSSGSMTSFFLAARRAMNIAMPHLIASHTLACSRWSKLRRRELAPPKVGTAPLECGFEQVFEHALAENGMASPSSFFKIKGGACYDDATDPQPEFNLPCDAFAPRPDLVAAIAWRAYFSPPTRIFCSAGQLHYASWPFPSTLR